MKTSLDKVRNIGFTAHIDAGKTTTTERVLFYTNKIHRLGEVHEGTAVMDWMPQEQERGITITAAATSCFWNDHKINVIDTPGHIDFTIEVERSLRVLDGMVAIFCAVGGVEAQSETVWTQANQYSIPRLAYINKMDRMGADFENVVSTIEERLGAKVLPLYLPIGKEDTFEGVIDLVRKKALYWTGKGSGEEYKEKEIPSSYEEKTQEAYNNLLEQLSEISDSVLEKFLDGKSVKQEELRKVIREAVLDFQFVPVLLGSSFKNIGVQCLLDAITFYLPSPADRKFILGKNPKEEGKEEKRSISEEENFSALAFKITSDPFTGALTFLRVYSGCLEAGKTIFNATRGKRERVGRLLEMHANHREEKKYIRAGEIAATIGLRFTRTGDTLCVEKAPILLESIKAPEPVISMAIEPKTTADADKLSKSLDILSLEDPTFQIKADEETGQVIVSGMGELHLEVLQDRLLREFRVQANMGKPQVSYRESVSQAAKASAEIERVIGGKKTYAKVLLSIVPRGRGEGFLFENKLKNKLFPDNFIDSIRRGVIEALDAGVFAGFPVVDIQVSLLDGDFREEESTEVAFKIASNIAFGRVCEEASPVLLEPIMKCEISTPEEYMGGVISDLSGRRGKVLEMLTKPQLRVIRGEVPLQEMFNYSTELRSLSQGRASYSIELDRYDLVDPRVSKKIRIKVMGKEF